MARRSRSERPGTDRAGSPWVPLVEPVLPALRTAGRGDLRGDDEHDGLAFDGLDLDGVSAERARFTECAFTGCRFGDARLGGGRLVSCVLADVAATTLEVPDSTWIEVTVRGGRVGALVGPGADLDRVAVRGTKLDYVTLRGARLSRVEFAGCRIGELDLGSARGSQVRFVDCEVGRLVLTGAALASLDLRGADLEALEGVAHLGGARITPAQLERLAPALAAHLGITVEPAE